jgi:hypothetical protein
MSDLKQIGKRVLYGAVGGEALVIDYYEPPASSCPISFIAISD